MSNIDIETQLQNKLSGAFSENISEETKARLWSNISNNIGKTSSIGNEIGTAQITGNTANTFLQIKYFLGGLSKYTITTIVSTVLLISATIIYFNYYDDNINDKKTNNLLLNTSKNDIKTEKIVNSYDVNMQLEKKEILYGNKANDNIEDIETSSLKNTVYDFEDEISMKNDISAIENNYEIKEEELINNSQQQASNNSIISAITSTNENIKEDNNILKSEIIPQTDTTKEANTIANNKTQQNQAVIVKNTVVIENKEVKIIRKKAKNAK